MTMGRTYLGGDTTPVLYAMEVFRGVDADLYSGHKLVGERELDTHLLSCRKETAYGNKS
jgi:methyl coenzyme M reductase gamma subunit